MMCLADQFLSDYHFREIHCRVIEASADEVFKAVLCYDPADDHFFRCMIRLRELPMRILGSLGLNDFNKNTFGLNNFTLLDQSEQGVVYGLVGQFWKLNYGQVSISDLNDFQSVCLPEYAKLILVFELKKVNNNETELVTETRVCCLGKASYKKFRWYWYLIRPISGLIRRRILQGINHNILRDT